MPEKRINLTGATLYRVGAAIFATALILNAVDSYKTYVQLANNIVRGGNPVDSMYESYAFLALALIIVLDGVGLILFKWTKKQLNDVVA